LIIQLSNQKYKKSLTTLSTRYISQLERLQRDTLQSIEKIKNIDEPSKAINDIKRKLEQLATKKDIENLPKIPLRSFKKR
jgi:hypothetical protein